MVMVVVMVVVVGGTQSLIHLPSFFQALPVVVDGGSVVVGVVDVVVSGVDLVLHVYEAPAATATLERAPWLDVGIYQYIKFKFNNKIKIKFNDKIKIKFNNGLFSYFL